MGIIYEDLLTFVIIFGRSPLRMRNTAGKTVEKIKIHFKSSKFLLPKKRAV